MLYDMGKAFVWYFEALVINAWSAIPGTSKITSLLVFVRGCVCLVFKEMRFTL